MQPIKRIKSHIFYLFFDDRSTARSCGCDQGPHAVLVPDSSGIDSYRGLLSCTFPRLSVMSSTRPRSPVGLPNPRNAMFYLIFHPLCPRGCTIIHTEGRVSVLTLRHLLEVLANGIGWLGKGHGWATLGRLKNPDTSRLMM